MLFFQPYLGSCKKIQTNGFVFLPCNLYRPISQNDKLNHIVIFLSPLGSKSCYEGDKRKYRGKVSHTEGRKTCVEWKDTDMLPDDFPEGRFLLLDFNQEKGLTTRHWRVNIWLGEMSISTRHIGEWIFLTLIMHFWKFHDRKG